MLLPKGLREKVKVTVDFNDFIKQDREPNFGPQGIGGISMRKFTFVLLLLHLVFLPSFSFAKKTQGFQECKQLCYLKECGEVSLRCPTTAQQRQFKTLCHSKCVEKMRRQAEERRLAAYRRALQLERERSARFFRLIKLRHRMWMQKKTLMTRLQIQYENARQRNETKRAMMVMARIRQAHYLRMSARRQAIAMRARFYNSRMRMRHRQRMELLRQVGRIRKQIATARARQDTQRINQLIKLERLRKQQVRKAQQSEMQLDIKSKESSVKEQKQRIHELDTRKKYIVQEKKEAKKKNDQAKLRALAMKLGQLAGQQAAAKKQLNTQKQKLQAAKVTYSSTFQ